MLHRAARAVPLVLMLATAAFAQAPAPAAQSPAPAAQSPAPPEDPLFRQLMDRDRAHNGANAVSSGPTPLYDAFYGNLGNANPAGPAATGQDFLKTYGPLLGFAATLNPATDVAVLSEAKTPGGSHLVFTPAVRGVPYLDASFAMDFDAAGSLVGVQGRYDSPAAAKMATIDVQAAVKEAIAEIARKSPGLAPSRGGTVEEFLHLTETGAIEQRFNVRLIVGDERRQRRVLLGPGGEVLEEDEDDDRAFEQVKK